MAQAKNRIIISFDGWKANNEVLDLLGVVPIILTIVTR